jgi:hypothetical protein
MGVAKKEKSRKEKQGKVGDGMNNVKTKGENFYRYNIGLPHGHGIGHSEITFKLSDTFAGRRRR